MIPPIIHQIWEGKTEPIMPNRLRILAESWKEKKPTWEYHLWSQTEMEQLVKNSFPDFEEIYFNFKYNVQRWDAIRYMILYKYGGFYADLDTECLEPSSGLMYDRLENSLFIPKIYNGDYTSKREVDMTSRPLDQEFVIGQPLQAHELAEAYGKGRLKGKLKEIAAKLDEESNPVIMLAKYKK